MKFQNTLASKPKKYWHDAPILWKTTPSSLKKTNKHFKRLSALRRTENTCLQRKGCALLL